MFKTNIFLVSDFETHVNRLIYSGNKDLGGELEKMSFVKANEETARVIEGLSEFIGVIERGEWTIYHYGPITLALRYRGETFYNPEVLGRAVKLLKLRERLGDTVARATRRTESGGEETGNVFDLIALAVDLPEWVDGAVVLNKTIFPVKKSRKNPLVYYFKEEWGSIPLREPILDVIGAPVVVPRDSQVLYVAYFWRRDSVLFFKCDLEVQRTPKVREKLLAEARRG